MKYNVEKNDIKIIFKLCCIFQIFRYPDIFLQIKNNCLIHKINDCIKNYAYKTVSVFVCVIIV